MAARSETTTLEKRKEYYERVPSIVEHNTGGKQRAMASISSVTQIAVDNGVVDPAKRVRTGVENGDLLREVEEFECLKCEYENHADYNAVARNL